MDAAFKDEEKLYRALKPKNCFWKSDGSLTSAAFKDSKGLSTDRDGGRDNKVCLEVLNQRFPEQDIVSVQAKSCKEVNACIKYLPEEDNDYHTEIHRSDTEITLSPGQAKHLARCAKIECK